MTQFDYELFSTEVRKTYGDAALSSLEGAAKFGEPGTYIPFSSEAINLALGVGGIPKGRIVEILGPESGGKTTLALDLCAQAQRMDKNAFIFYIDAENSLNPVYAEVVGVETKKTRFGISQTNELEEASDLAMKAAKFGAKIVVIDSIPTLEYAKQLDADEAIADRAGGIAKPLRAVLKRLGKVCRESGTIVVLINHITYKIGTAAMYGNPETSPCGSGPKYYASIRLDVRPESGGDLLDKKGDKIGRKTKVKVVKNKVAPPFREAVFNLIYNEGIDTYADLIEVGQKVNVLVKSGSWIKYGTEHQWQGAEKAADALKADAKLEAKLRAAVQKALRA
jgi:recombination protein RecA